MFLVEKLVVYQKAVVFGNKIVGLCRDAPRGMGRPLLDQILRASTSIAANLAEGNGRWTIPDRKNFFRIARGSMLECLPMLEFLKTLGVIEEAQKNRLRNDLEELSRMINALIEGTKERGERHKQLKKQE